jgi:hypothetical protein
MLQLLDLGVEQAQKLAGSTAVFDGDDLGLPLVPNYDKLTEPQKGVMVNMLFNMGPGGTDEGKGLGGFKGMRKALAKGDTLKAAVEMIDSGWYGQVKDRSRELVEQMGMDRATQKEISDVLKQRGKKDGLTRQEANEKIDEILKKLRDQQQPQQNPAGGNPPPSSAGTVPPLTALPVRAEERERLSA